MGDGIMRGAGINAPGDITAEKLVKMIRAAGCAIVVTLEPTATGYRAQALVWPQGWAARVEPVQAMRQACLRVLDMQEEDARKFGRLK